MPLSLTPYRRLLTWYFVLPALVVGTGVLVPLGYLLLRALEADGAQVEALIWRGRTLYLLGNTLVLTAGVLLFSTALAFPLAWLTTRTDVSGKRLVTLLGVLPLAVPGYVMAYILLATTGAQGTLARLFGLEGPRLHGYFGAWLALGLSTYPYLFLNLRTALLGLDPSLEETARTLGHTRRQVFFRVTLPQLRPAFYAGALLVGLHVLGDFGVVSLMRFETFSFALYSQYAAAYDRIYAAWLALMLLGLTGTVLWLETRLLRNLRLHRTATSPARRRPPSPLGGGQPLAWLFVAAVALFSLLLPLLTIGYWLAQIPGSHLRALLEPLGASFAASVPAALLAAALALPLAYLGVRRPSPVSRALERIAYLGYATPPLAFALAMIFFTLRALPFAYQTLGLLIVAYALHFLAEAVGPVRSSLYQASPRLEEAARTLGRSPLRAFFAATFPLLRRGVLVSMALVFLSAMKELPLTFLLSPPGFETLALNVWSYTNEALFGQAAPHALTILLFSSAFVGLLLRDGDRERGGSA
jgi:iron(III) transport system permease protein